MPAAGAAPAVLVLIDEGELPDTLLSGLEQGGSGVRRCRNANQALVAFQRDPFDLVLLDSALADVDGLKLLSEIRKISAVPIVMLSAQPDPTDIVQSFELGADDYIQMPIEPALLIERLAWFVQPRPVEGVTAGRLRLWPDRHLLEIDGQTLGLTEVESKILGCLMASSDQTVSAAALYQAAWPPFEVSARQILHMVETAVVQLQNKIEADPKQPALITPVQGGYRLHAALQPEAG